MTTKIIIRTSNLAIIENETNGDAHNLDALLGGRFVTRKQTHNMADYSLAGINMRIIKCCPIATQSKKISRNIVEIFHCIL